MSIKKDISNRTKLYQTIRDIAFGHLYGGTERQRTLRDATIYTGWENDPNGVDWTCHVGIVHPDFSLYAFDRGRSIRHFSGNLISATLWMLACGPIGDSCFKTILSGLDCNETDLILLKLTQTVADEVAA